MPTGAWTLDGRFARGLGKALELTMYAYLGYYQVCYLGDEVADPSRTFPRAILISTVAVAAIYLTMNLSVLGVLPWREVIGTRHVASDFMLARFGPRAARAITGPSAVGSEKGTPSSMRSAPPRSRAATNSGVRSGAGSPAVR